MCSQPNLQSKPQKEGAESEQFWELLGGKSEYPSQKIVRESENDPHLFSCAFLKGMNIINLPINKRNLLIFVQFFILQCILVTLKLSY